MAEVYRKNTRLDTANFQKEYWLDKEGVKVGKNDKAVYVYHNTHISSSQWDKANNAIVFNLDYAPDHPLLHMPLLPDTTNVKIDRSKNHYAAGGQASYSFSISVGLDNSCFPRFMQLPSGYEAAMLFTEHADFADLRTHRAVYFGSEDITTAAQATGGFVKWNIPVTKSVFYCNPDSFKKIRAGILKSRW